MPRRQRIDRLDNQLTPLQHILAWVAEVREFPTLGDYARSTLAEPPLPRIFRRVTRSAEASPPGIGARPAAGRESVGRAASANGPLQGPARRRAIRDTGFRYELAIRLNELTRDGGRDAALAVVMSLLSYREFYSAPILALKSGHDFEQHITDDGPAFWSQWVVAARRALEDAEVLTTARARLQRRYFGGRDVLFTEAAAAERALDRFVDELASLVNEGMPGSPAPRGRRPHARGARAEADFLALVDATVREIRDDARVAAMHLLGDDDGASKVMETQLRRGA